MAGLSRRHWMHRALPCGAEPATAAIRLPHRLHVSTPKDLLRGYILSGLRSSVWAGCISGEQRSAGCCDKSGSTPTPLPTLMKRRSEAHQGDQDPQRQPRQGRRSASSFSDSRLRRGRTRARCALPADASPARWQTAPAAASIASGTGTHARRLGHRTWEARLGAEAGSPWRQATPTPTAGGRPRPTASGQQWAASVVVLRWRAAVGGEGLQCVGAGCHRVGCPSASGAACDEPDVLSAASAALLDHKLSAIT